MKNIIMKHDIDFSEKLIATLESLQVSGNDAILMYIEHLDKVSDALFRMGNDMAASESKNELFEMLHTNHMLRKDLEALKAAN